MFRIVVLAVWFMLGMLWTGAGVAHAQAINPTDPNQALSTRELWSAVVGIITPLLLAVPIQPTWPTWGRAVFGLVCEVIIATATAVIDGSFALSGTDAVFRSILLVLLAAWSSYVAFWKQTGVTLRIELATSGWLHRQE